MKMKKMKRNVSLLLVLLVFMVCLSGCTATSPKSTAGKSLTIGYIMGGPEEWQQCQADGAKFACDKLGYEMITLNSDYTPEKEITNAEDLISKGVDAIVMFTVNAESGQKVAKMCNDAKIPLFLLDGNIGEGEGKAVTIMSYSFYDLGYMIGKFVSENYPGAKMVYITGLPGAGIVEDYSKGLHTAIKDAGKGVEVVAEQPADWDRAKTISVMESLVTGGTEFSVAFVNNEDMATGAIQVLEENNLLDKVAVIATGGSEAGINLIKEGKLTMTCAASPAYEGVYMIKIVKDYFEGKEVPQVISVPTTPITADNIDKAITWKPDDNMYNSIFN